MPTERFNRLPERKKNTIRRAAMKEFARVPFEKVSINQIIKTACISRGSFYTYFDGKQDLADYLVWEVGQKLENRCLKTLEENGGDYFDLMDSMFDFNVEMLNEEWQLFDVIRCIFSSPENFRAIDIPPAGTAIVSAAKTSNQTVSPAEWFFERIDTSRFRPDNRLDISPLISLGGAALFLSLKQYYEHPEALEKIRNNYHRSINILRHGALRAHAETSAQPGPEQDRPPA
ncbi:MAG: TetR family transcriptional regulator [Clostridiales bacterium]|nr:TetR family transcriptional regulator [Clostridiales bacterium]